MPRRMMKLKQSAIDGMRDNPTPDASVPNKVALMRNCYPEVAAQGAAIIGRPGYRITEDNRLGTPGFECQLIYQYTKLDGTETTIAVAGGLMYTYNWGTRAWANVALSGVSLPATGAVFATTFADLLVINPNDGSNKPFTWDGTTFVSLTNAALAWGPIVVYYAKLFMIKATERSTLVWSEENVPNTGYEAGGFNNAWTLGQTDQEPLFALYATNESLVYFRERSIGAISGAVTPDFVNTGVRDGVSETLGTNAPASVVGHESEIYFLDPEGRPHVIERGGTINLTAEFWDDFSDTIAGLPKANLIDAVAIDYSPAQQIWFAVRGAGATLLSKSLVVSYERGVRRAVGVFDGYTMDTVAMVKDSNGVPAMVHCDNGYFYDHGNPDGSLWDDGEQAGDVAIVHRVVFGNMGNDTSMEKVFDRLDVVFRTFTPIGSVNLEYLLPRASHSVGTLPLAGGGGDLWNFFLWDAGVWGGLGLEQHIAVGLNGIGRWIRPKLTHQVLTQRFGIASLTVDAYPATPEPLAR